MQKVLWVINHAINLIFPNICGICESISKEDLCKKCEIKLNNIAKIKIDNYNDKNFKKHLYIFRYEGIIKERLRKFKFREKAYIYKALVKFLIKNKKVCRFLKSYDIIIPVPIHYNRKVIRGYNQSALIAMQIAKKIDIEYNEKVLLKKVNNKPQSMKSKEERKRNVIDVYYIENKAQIYNKKVILLDDIYTTGSTVNECCKILKLAGAKYVDVITIAKD